MEHYKNLLSALAGAMPACMVWLLAGTEDNYFNARDVFAFALSEGGEEEEMEEGQFYVVSEEGAIGIAANYEYLTRWLFIPVVDEKVMGRELLRMKDEMSFDMEHENDEPQEERTEAYEPAEEEGEKEQPVPPQPMMQPQGQPVPPQPISPQPMQPQGQSIPPQPMQPQGKKRFCMQCGFQLNANSKFCPKCGTPVQR